MPAPLLVIPSDMRRGIVTFNVYSIDIYKLRMSLENICIRMSAVAIFILVVRNQYVILLLPFPSEA
jgi:hypothetical protein